MIYFVTGAKGQLGTDVVRKLEHSDNIVYATDYDTINITDRSQVLNCISKCNPDVIIHCAAWTAVDLAEIERDEAYDVNVNGTKNMVEAAMITNAKLIFISSDYVYDGQGSKVHKETDLLSPVNYYAETKMLAEEEVLKYSRSYIIRTSWLFGGNGKNFVKKILELSRTQKEISVVENQVGSPTYTKDLAKVIEEMSYTTEYGIYNVTNEGFCSLAEFAKYIIDLKGQRTIVESVNAPINSSKAKRSLNSRLSKDKLEENGFDRLPSWQDSVRVYVALLERSGEI